jgi:polyisoprenoid-binding protein YceI
VGFSIKHLMVATVRGSFERFGAELETDATGLVRATGVVEAASLVTGDAKRDEVVCGPSFLDAGTHPGIAFASRKIEHLAGGAIRVLGDLTIRGTSRPVQLSGTVTARRGDNEEDVRMDIVIGGSVSRSEFGVTGHGVLERSGAALSDGVKIALELSAARIDEDS